MRFLPIMFGGFVMVAFASPAAGEPANDTGFLDSVRSAGLTYTDSQGAIAFAKSVCGSMGRGEAGPQLVTELQTNNPALTADHAAKFVALSAKYYCPEQLNNH